MLSVTQTQTLNSCAREWVFKYKQKIYPEETPKYFIVGIAFHRVCEGVDTYQSVDLQGLDESVYPYRAALKVMHESYQKAIEPFGYTAYPELKFEGDKIRGVVDGICIHNDNTWSLVERKTTSKLEPQKILTEDLQIGAYAAMAKEIAADLLFDLNEFKGVMYTQTLKPTERKRKAETLEEFGARLTSETLVIEIPKDKIRTDIVMSHFNMAAKKIVEIEALYNKTGNVLSVPGETKNCMRFGKPCGYYSRCYGVSDEEKTRESQETHQTSGRADVETSQPTAAELQPEGAEKVLA